jgi:hypothetical protein
MRVEPRQQLLEIWDAVARYSYPNGSWQWGGRDGSNSISDAEQLLCILGPATSIEPLALDDPDRIAEDVLGVLSTFGGIAEISRVLLRAITDYMRRYTDDTGTPVFSCESYFRVGEPEDGKLSTDQSALHVVDSFAISISLSLATIGFVRQLRKSYREPAFLDEVSEVETMAGRRLTAAMVGLLRSFSVDIFDIDSRDGRSLIRTVNQTRLPNRQIVADLRESLREIRASLRDVTMGSGANLAEALDEPNRLFECGWSWGVVRDAPTIKTSKDIGEQPPGVADPVPYIYFTVVALDGIAALFSERTRLLGLLDEEQQRLAQNLQLRWELTQSYWSKIASFGTGGRWPLEDIPWQRTTERESEYFSLLVSSIVVQDLIVKRASDSDLNRVGLIFEELANRSRITRRVFSGDEAYALHAPGFPLTLGGSAIGGGPKLVWMMSDFSPLLLKRTMRLAGLLGDTALRRRMLALADQVWAHLNERKLKVGDAERLWDQPHDAFPQYDVRYDEPSWYFTKRVTDCLVTASDVISRPPLRSDVLAEIANHQLSEAEHIFDQELLHGSSTAGPAMLRELQELRAKLNRAREVLDERPGTAIALASEILVRLAGFTAARSDFDGML